MSVKPLKPIVRYLDMTFELGRFDNEHLRSLFRNGQYENTEIWMVQQYLDPELPVVEFGGALGVVSCVINRSLKHPKNHTVVEANPYLIALLRKNQRRNGCQFKVVPRALGYGAKVTIHCSRRNPCMGNIFRQYDDQLDVSTTTLRKLIGRRGNITVVSDMEGAEDALFNNEIDVLSERVKLLVFESHPEYLGKNRVQQQCQELVDGGFEPLFSESSFHVFLNTRL